MKKTKKLAIIIICIVLVLGLAIGGICLFLFTPLFKSPKQQLVYAATKTFYEEPSALYGSDGLLILSLLADGKFNYSTEFALDKIKLDSDAFGISDGDLINYKMLAGVYMGQDGSVSIPDRQYYSSTTIRYTGFRLTQTDAYIDDSDVYLTDQKLLDGNLYFNTESFGDDYQDSIFYDSLEPFSIGDVSINDKLSSISFNIFDSLDDMQSYIQKLVIKDRKKTISSLHSIYDDIDVERTGRRKSCQVGEHEEYCNEYAVTLPLSVLEDLDISGADDLIDALDDDFEFYVYVDSKYRIVAITHEYELPMDKVAENISSNLPDEYAFDFPSINYELEVRFCGTEYVTSNINVSLLFTNADTDNELADITCAYSYDKSSKEYTADLTFNDNEISSEGTIESDLKSFTMDTEDITIDFDTEIATGQIECSALFSMSELEDDVETLSGKDYKIFEMSYDEYSDLFIMIEENFFPF